MTDSLGDILSQRPIHSEPQEFPIIRTFVKERFDIVPNLSKNRGSITISVPNSAVAGSLRLVLHELNDLCKTDSSLVIRIK